MNPTGTLYGVGVGPGDPELLTLKAVRVIQTVPVVAYPANSQGYSQARAIAAPWLTGQREIPISMPFQTDRGPANQAYDQAATLLREILAAGESVAVLCEGDPLFFGSFSYLYQRLADAFPGIVIPGITSVSAATAVTELSLATGHERIAIIPATAREDAIRQALTDYDSIAIIKPGRHRPRIVELLEETGRAADALYVEQATRQDQRIIADLGAVPRTPGPYFALFLITRGAHS